jgi:hypothetical protein
MIWNDLSGEEEEEDSSFIEDKGSISATDLFADIDDFDDIISDDRYQPQASDNRVRFPPFAQEARYGFPLQARPKTLRADGIYVDEDQKDHEIVDFLQIKQKSSEAAYSFIERFQKQRLRVEDMGFEPNDVITRKTFMDRLLPKIRGKLEEGARPRTYEEAKRRAKKSSVLMDTFLRVMEKEA